MNRFKNVKKSLVNFYTNCHVCMITEIFNESLLKWDKNLNKKIVIIIINNFDTYKVTSFLKKYKNHFISKKYIIYITM